MSAITPPIHIMQFSSFKSWLATGVLAFLAGCGGSSNDASNTSSSWIGIGVDSSAVPTKLFLANFLTNVVGSVPIAGGTFASMSNASAGFSGPGGVTLVGANLMVVDSLNHVIRQVSTVAPYTTTTFAGTVGTSGNSETNATYPTGLFNAPRNAVADAAGNLYITDSGNNSVRMITPAKVVSTIATGFRNPWGITMDNATPPNLYVTDIGTNSVKKLTLSAGVWSVSTLAGNSSGISGLPSNANGTAAFFNYPLGITTDGAYLYVVDQGNNAIRRIDLATRDVLLMAGSSIGAAGSAVNATGTLATFSSPFAITYGAGTLYVTDQDGARIRKIGTTTPYPVTAFILN
jgi:YVTN family beta-propeller protein